MIVNRIWLWEREKKKSQQGILSFENCSYLAFGKRCSHTNPRLIKNTGASYMYLTRNKDEAAVFRYHDIFSENDIQPKVEVQLTKSIQDLSHCNWYYKRKDEQFTKKNLNTFTILYLKGNSTFTLTVKYNHRSVTKTLSRFNSKMIVDWDPVTLSLKKTGSKREN